MINFSDFFFVFRSLKNNDSKQSKNIIYWHLLIKEVSEICIYFNNDLNHIDKLVKNINEILCTISRYIFKKIKASLLKPCLSDPAESTLQSSPVKLWPVKPLASEKNLSTLHPGDITQTVLGVC